MPSATDDLIELLGELEQRSPPRISKAFPQLLCRDSGLAGRTDCGCEQCRAERAFQHTWRRALQAERVAVYLYDLVTHASVDDDITADVERWRKGLGDDAV